MFMKNAKRIIINPISELIEVKKMASRYQKLSENQKVLENKIVKLRKNKEQFTRSRYEKLHEEFLTDLKYTKSDLFEMQKTMENRISLLSQTNRNIYEELKELKLKILEEEKLFEIGATSKSDYKKKLKSLIKAEKQLMNNKESVKKHSLFLRCVLEDNSSMNENDNLSIEQNEYSKQH